MNKISANYGNYMTKTKCDRAKEEGSVLPSELSDLLALRKEIIEVLQLMVYYGMIHTITAVIYPDGTHKEAIDRGNELLYKLKKQG